MRRLNVRFSQIEECIRTSMFALDALPANPELEEGEELLLQLVKSDAVPRDLEHKRIQFVLRYARSQRDVTGAISREHWPEAGKTWRYVLFCSATEPCMPFSLEDLPLSKDYGGQGNAIYIVPGDQQLIRPFLKSASGSKDQATPTSVHGQLDMIRNYDRIVLAGATRRTTVAEHERALGDPWPGNALKVFYEHRCQICLHDFKPRYDVPYADTRFLTPLTAGGKPVSRNTIVVCPNHDAILGATHARFDPGALAFRYPNNLVEKLTLRDHLLN